MKFMSFNTQHCLNYIERQIDFEVMAKAIRDTGADIVGLNEMRGAGTDPEYTAQTEKLAELTGLKYYAFAKAIDVPNGGPYGNAILSRYPIDEVTVTHVPDPAPKEGVAYETRCLLKARIGGFTVCVIHFGLDIDEQKNAVATVLSCIEDARCVLMGDFNVIPENPVLLPIRARMRDTAEQFSAPHLSFPSDAPRCKIDYIFASPDLTVLEADIPAIVASDHRPHVAVIQ